MLVYKCLTLKHKNISQESGILDLSDEGSPKHGGGGALQKCYTEFY